ncbi:D-alanine--D-alanine ligase [Sessilibacter corallicola]|uniref:D-alanine--D-alanine ligase n=1 Tax=Sessilibacter corallicola TaxID=2904075 RepID=A0ABQ0A3Q8_9GAMM
MSGQLIQQLGRVAVLYGGTSAEREISLKSGKAISRALDAAGVDIVEIDLGAKPISQLIDQNIDRAFIALHGPGGEDGKIQAALELLGIPYTGSNVQASALAMDKLKSKYLWLALGLPTPNFEVLTATTDWDSCLNKLGGKAMVKPAHEGSSIGMSKVDCADDLRIAYENACQFDPSIIAEELIEGAEYTVTVLANRCLSPIKVVVNNTFYDYQAKYFSDETQYLIPCGLDEEKLSELCELALKAFESVGCSGWGRVDFMADQQGNFYLLEVNTVPGMTDHSLVPMAANSVGLSFQDLCVEIISQTLVKETQ